MEIIKVILERKQLECKKGISLLELSQLYENKRPLKILAAKVNNKVKDLRFTLEEDSDVKFLDLTTDDGVRVYKRSLFFILMKAVKAVFPDRKLKIRHSLSRGTYCEITGDQPLQKEELQLIEEKMHDYVRQNIPLEKNILPIEEAKKLFSQSKDYDKVSLLKFCSKETLSVYSCGNLINYLYGNLVPHTGYINKFELLYYKPGFILRYPDKDSPYEIPEFVENRKIFQVINEHKKWGDILEIPNVGALNQIIASGKAKDVIHLSEVLHEKKLAYIADQIKENSQNIKIVLISGPSSSGKTTFAHRLAIHLRVNGIQPITISLDDYFLGRDWVPLDEYGQKDFEAVEALDIDLFNDNISRLIKGETIEAPIFNFHTGKREPKGKIIKLYPEQIIIVEGIHGLNERLTAMIPKKNKFKIYISALTQLSIDDYNPISTTDTRCIRRLVRDFKFRSSSASKTLEMWPSVRRGEMKNIFPFQEEADVMFNSALVYELALLKEYALPLLESIDPSQEEYSEARRLIDFLSYFLTINAEHIPNTSIIREFIGGSSLY